MSSFGGLGFTQLLHQSGLAAGGIIGVDNPLFRGVIQRSDGKQYRLLSRLKLTGKDKPLRLGYIGLALTTNRLILESLSFRGLNLFWSSLSRWQYLPP
jgi:hypothetical protein